MIIDRGRSKRLARSSSFVHVLDKVLMVEQTGFLVNLCLALESGYSQCGIYQIQRKQEQNHRIRAGIPDHVQHAAKHEECKIHHEGKDIQHPRDLETFSACQPEDNSKKK